MIRSLVILSALALVVACGDSNPESPERQPQEVKVDSFNVALAGAFIPFEAERRQPLADAIAAHDADILCLQEVWTREDKEMIRDAAAEAFPYVVFFPDNLDTVIDDPTDQQGEIPPTPTTVPCPDEVFGMDTSTMKALMDAAIDCVSANCSTDPGSEDGRTTSTSCATKFCTPVITPILFGTDPQHGRCYACIAPQLPTSTFREIRESCPTVVNQELAFGGQNGVMVLSRHPLKDSEDWVLPGTWNRRTILKTTAELPNGAELDTYCNHLTPIFNPASGINVYPYTGQYGVGSTLPVDWPAGWQAEQELQAEKLINYVASESGERPAVILGDFNSGIAFPAQDIVAEGEETYQLLEAAYTPAYTAEYLGEPLCTFCSTNPVTNPDNDPNATSVWIDHIFLHNLPESAVRSTARVFDDDLVPVIVDEVEIVVPLSDHFGMRSVIVVP